MTCSGGIGRDSLPVAKPAVACPTKVLRGRTLSAAASTSQALAVPGPIQSMTGADSRRPTGRLPS